jgi:hypothetical protein
MRTSSLLILLVSLTLCLFGWYRYKEGHERLRHLQAEQQRIEEKLGREAAENPKEKREEGPEDRLPPVQQTQDVVELCQRLEKEIAAMTPVVPLDWKELGHFLPAAPNGFKPEEQGGGNVNLAGRKYSFASRAYQGQKQRFQISIQDGAYNRHLYIALLLGAQEARDTTDGYERGVIIRASPGQEKYNHKSKQAELWMVASKRFTVKLKGEGVDPGLLRRVYSDMEFTDLPKAK